jgi:hypothetical protein
VGRFFSRSGPMPTGLIVRPSRGEEAGSSAILLALGEDVGVSLGRPFLLNPGTRAAIWVYGELPALRTGLGRNTVSS